MTQPLDLWLNWALYSVLGRMAVADTILHDNRSAIYAVARELSRDYAGRVGMRLHRGLLLEPELAREGLVPCQSGVESVSFTEDERVARWFAARGSVISELVAAQKPRARGYLARHTPYPEDLLFHHAWPLTGALPQLARLHPDIDDQQLAWNLRTQREVIVKPYRGLLAVEPCDPDPGETRALDELLCWPGAL